jgi:hypothetical protein
MVRTTIQAEAKESISKGEKEAGTEPMAGAKEEEEKVETGGEGLAEGAGLERGEVGETERVGEERVALMALVALVERVERVEREEQVAPLTMTTSCL